jgi:two-component system CheB/CheR fusion protein
VAAEEPLPVEADRDRLQQILQNIIGNAIKFTPAGGTITVTAAPSDGSGTVGIVDTGQGITPEFLPFVFEMFRREQHGADPGPPGLGIGLALVRRLVELHGGDIRVSSAGTGHGTTVLLRLPLVGDAPTPPPPHASAERRSRTFAGLRILVVEDADDVRTTLKLLLESLGARVDAASDGLEGLEALASNHPDVVLCDVQMPRLDGFELVKRLRADRRGPQPPVIAITGTGIDGGRSSTAAAGFNAHLDKPVDEQDLILAIQSVLPEH